MSVLHSDRMLAVVPTAAGPRGHRAPPEPRPCPLTGAELRALSLLMGGRTYQQIAEQVSRKPSTIRSQLQSAYRRLGVSTSYQAVLVCVQEGWLDWDDEDPNRSALRRIEATFERLLAAVEQRVDEEDAELTDRQRGYLRAFEQQLRAGGPARRATARHHTSRALAEMLSEAGVTVVPGRPQGDLLRRLSAVADRADLERTG